MENKELITIAVAVYNSADYLSKCLESVRNQTYSNLEVIMVVDGEMKDDSEKICRAFEGADTRFRMVKIKHAGLPQVRNLGVENASGKYVAFIDGDDWIERDAYERMYAAITEKKADMAVSAYYLEKDGKAYVKGTLNQEEIKPYEMLKGVISGRLENFMWNKLYKKDLFDGIKFLTDKIVDDMSVMHLLIDRCGRIAVVNEPLNHYIKHKGSVISGRNYKMRLDILELLMLQCKYILAKYPELERDIVENLYDGYVSMALSEISNNYSERKKYRKMRKELDNYYRQREEALSKYLGRAKYNILRLIWREHYIANVLALLGETARRIFVDRSIHKL